MKTSASLLLLGVATCYAKEVIWNGRSAAFDDANNWMGADPTSSKVENQPGYSIFGNTETNSGTIVTMAPSGTYTVGSKIELYGKVKILLGDGTGKTKLNLEAGDGGVAEFLPGSKNYPQDNKQMAGFDFNCHMNWRDSYDPAKYYAKPPCEGDSVIVSTTQEAGSDPSFSTPDHITEGEGLFLSTFDVPTYMRRLSIEDPSADAEAGDVSSFSDSDCIEGEGSISSGAISIFLGDCSYERSATTFFKTTRDQDDEDCKTTCPAVGTLEDGSLLQQIVDYETGEDKLILIKFDTRGKGAIDDATITSEVGEDGHTYYTVTEEDGTFFEHIMESNTPGIIKKRTTTTTITATTTSVTTTSVTTTSATTITSTTTLPADDIFTLVANPADGTALDKQKSSDITLLAEKLNKQLADCQEQYGFYGGMPGEEDKCATQRAAVDTANTAYTASAAREKKAAEGGGGSGGVIAAVIIVLILVVGGAYWFTQVREGGGGGGGGKKPTPSFENPMYDSKPAANPNEEVAYDAPAQGGGGGGGGMQGASGYADVQAAPEQTPASGYMDIAAGGGGGGGENFGGFDDGPAAGDPGGGYMDVQSGGGDNGYDDYGDDEEDV